MKLHLKITLFFLTILLFACNRSDKISFLPKISGLPGEVLVVIPDSIWRQASGDTLKKILNTSFEGLPQIEPLFNIIQINPGAFGKLFKHHRNIIIVKVNPQYSEIKFGIQKNLWAKGQLIITIITPNNTDFIRLANANRTKIQNLFQDVEQLRLTEVYSQNINEVLVQKIKYSQQLQIIVPKEYKMDFDTGNFIRLSHEYRDIFQGIFIYNYPFSDSNTFTKEFLIERRNEMLKKYVHGEKTGSYMTTEILYPPVFIEHKQHSWHYTAELRGLWRMQNGLSMGGPFVSISWVDKKRKRAVTVEGFVFAPAHEKRNLLLEVEAIIRSIKLTN